MGSTLENYSLEDVHRQLMAAVRSGVDALPKDLDHKINDMGFMTQEFLANAAEGDSLKTTPLVAACEHRKPKIIETLLNWHAAPSYEQFEYLLDPSAAKNNDDLIVQLIQAAPKLMGEYAFMLAVVHGKKHVVSSCIKLGLPQAMEWTNRSNQVTLFQKELRDVSIHVASKGDTEMLKILDPCLVVSPTPLYETLYLTAAFYAHEETVKYVLERMNASPEARIRAKEIMGAANTLDNKSTVAKTFYDFPGVKEKGIFDGDIKAFLKPKEGDKEQGLRWDTVDEYSRALTIMERHFRHRGEFQIALLKRHFSIDISTYTLDVIMHPKGRSITAENLDIIKDHLVKLSFDTVDNGDLCVMKIVEWCIAAIGYLPDLDNPNPQQLPPMDYEEEGSEEFRKIRKSLQDTYNPPPKRADFVKVADFSCWVLWCLENCKTFDLNREWFMYMLRRIVRLSATKSKDHSLLHRLIEMRAERHGKGQEIFDLLHKAGAEMTAVDTAGNTLLHKIIAANKKKPVPDVAKLLDILITAGVPVDAKNAAGHSVKDEVSTLLKRKL